MDSSRTAYTAMLGRVYAAVCSFVSDDSFKAAVGALTVDGWTNTSGESVMGACVIYVDKNWNLVTSPLRLVQMGESRETKENLRDCLATMISESKVISPQFIVWTITHDNEASISAAVNEVGDSSVRCIAHTIALAVNSAFDLVPEAANFVNQAHAIAVFVHHHEKVRCQSVAILLKTSDKLTQLA